MCAAPSWRVDLDRWSTLLDCALWLRAAERIDVPAGGVVPGPADVEPMPSPTRTAPTPGLTAGWRAWWQTLIEADRSAQPDFHPPGFPGLAECPELRRVVIERWQEANDWHNARKCRGLRAGLYRDAEQTQHVMAQVEQELGRKARPFSLTLLVLPVRDHEVRSVHPTRCLVPERVYDGPEWPELLRALVLPLAT